MDFGANAQTLGYYNQEREWSLIHETKNSQSPPPVKVCGKGDPIAGKQGKPDKNGNTGCGAYIFASAKICSYCGYIFENETEVKKVDLIQIDYAKPVTFEKNWFDELLSEAEARGYQYGWVINRIIAKMGAEGLKEFAKHQRHRNGWLYGTMKRYNKAIRNFEQKKIESN